MARGDHLYVHCVGYTHHGIDCGDGTVIHHPGKLDRKIYVAISRTSMALFSFGKQALIKNYGTCDLLDVAIQRAESQLGQPGYNLFDNNCEHFATWCKTGKKDSEQVTRATSTATGGIGSGVAVAGGIGVVSATGAAVGLSGAGIMSGLATVGGVVGGGAVAGINVLGAAPALATTAAMNEVLKDSESFSKAEREARAVGRTMTTAGAVAGSVAATGAISAAGSVAGLSAAGITSGLAAIGGTVGGGMVAGVAITAAAPAVAAAAVGYGAYCVWRWLSN